MRGVITSPNRTVLSNFATDHSPAARLQRATERIPEYLRIAHAPQADPSRCSAAPLSGLHAWHPPGCRPLAAARQMKKTCCVVLSAASTPGPHVPPARLAAGRQARAAGTTALAATTYILTFPLRDRSDPLHASPSNSRLRSRQTTGRSRTVETLRDARRPLPLENFCS